MNDATLKRTYGLTREQWDALLDACHHRCPACMKPFSPSRLAAVDHNHMTGEVRGVLCAPCNYEIGTRHDKAQWFHRVAMYLFHPPARRVIGRIYVPGSPGAEETP